MLINIISGFVITTHFGEFFFLKIGKKKKV